MLQYNTKGYTDDPLHSSNGNSRNFLGHIDDFLGNLLFGDPDASSNIVGELTGYNAQQREFQQQEYLMEKDMQWNDERSRMERMKAAGINPNAAASGIAGQSSDASAPTVASNQGGLSQGLNAVSGLANAITGGKASLADAAFKNATGEATAEKLRAESRKSFADIGLTNAQTASVMIDNKYADANWESELNIKRQQFENMKQEYQILLDNHNLILEQIKDVQSHINVNESLAAYQESLKAKVDEELDWMKKVNDFCERNHLYLRESGVDGYIASMIFSGASMEQFDKFVETYSNYRGRVAKAEAHARETEAAERTWHERPSNEYEYSIYYGEKFGHAFKNELNKYNSFGDFVRGFLKGRDQDELDFEDSYSDRKEMLRNDYRKALALYKRYKHSGASDMAKIEFENKKDIAYKKYKEYDRDAHFKYLKEHSKSFTW